MILTMRSFFLSLILTVAATSYGQDDVSITVSHEFIEDEIEKLIEDEVEKAKNVSVEVAKRRSNMVRIVADLDYEISGPNVGVKLTIDLLPTCNADGFSLRIVDWDDDYDYLRFVPIPAFIHNIFSDRFINDDIVREAEQMINDEIPPFDNCSRIQILSRGDIRIFLGDGIECDRGERRIDACPAAHRGEGKFFTCDRGFWKFLRNDCQFCGFTTPSCETVRF